MALNQGQCAGRAAHRYQREAINGVIDRMGMVRPVTACLYDHTVDAALPCGTGRPVKPSHT